MTKALTLFMATLTIVALAQPMPRPPARPMPKAVHIPKPIHRPPAPPPHHLYRRAHHSHHGDFWTGFGIGTLSGFALQAAAPCPPPPPPPPVVAVNPIWIAPLYEQRPIYNAFGHVIRYERVVVRPGYWQY